MPVSFENGQARTPLVLSLSDIHKEDVNFAGGKGANLGELINQGFPVPPGFVIAAEVYQAFVTDLDLPVANQKIEDVSALCATIRYKIVAKTLPHELEELIRSQHNILVTQKTDELVYAVRSSATAEDMSDASFAGQHDTYYYVDMKNLSLMIKKCWASLWSDAAFSYRQSQGIEHRDVNMAVVVQEMVRSDISGVTFTADPMTGDDDIVVTESSWGMGAAIVDGRVSPDRYVVEKNESKLISTRIADKKFMVPAYLDRQNVSRLEEVPSQMRRRESLSLEQILLVTEWAKKSENYFGRHQDLEWSFEGDRFYMLQSRPITILGRSHEDVPDGKFVLFKPMAENFTDPLLPLSQDLLVRVFPMMNIIYGRAYMRLAAARILVPLKITDEDLATLAYLGEVRDFEPSLSLPKFVGLSLLLYFLYLVFGVLYMRTSEMPDDFMEKFRNRYRRFVNDPEINAPATLQGLFLKTGFFESIGNMVLLVNIAAPRYIFLLALLKKLLQKWLPELRPDAASLLSSGSEGVLSTEMGREIWQLAKTVKLSPDVADILLKSEPDKALGKIRHHANSDIFMAQLEKFLARHGHRTLKEFELNSVRWEEDPSPVMAMVRNYLLVDSDPEASEALVAQQRDALETEIEAGLSKLPLEALFGIRRKIIGTLRHKAKYFIKLRENSRFYHIMGFYAVRQKVLAVEAQLMKRGALKCKDDIFYLDWQQVEKLQSEELGWSDVEELIRSRRMHHIKLSKMHAPKTIGIEVKDRSPVDESSDQLNGQGASTGLYQGHARVIMDPATDAEIKPGEILIAPYTDPAWTPLFLIANAAVIEVGSYLSHAGTIAREYGMPCVVDVENCTTIIGSGDLIEVDGANGLVTLIEKRSATDEKALPTGKDKV